MAFMQLGGELGGRVVHTGREKFLGELSPKLGKPKKHPAYCIYLAYRLERGGSGEERGEGEISGERAAAVIDEMQKSPIEKRKRNLKTISPHSRGEREI